MIGIPEIRDWVQSLLDPLCLNAHLWLARWLKWASGQTEGVTDCSYWEPTKHQCAQATVTYGNTRAASLAGLMTGYNLKFEKRFKCLPLESREVLAVNLPFLHALHFGMQLGSCMSPRFLKFGYHKCASSMQGYYRSNPGKERLWVPRQEAWLCVTEGMWLLLSNFQISFQVSTSQDWACRG